MTLAIWAFYLKDKLNTGTFVNSIVDRNFVGSAYYWMFPFRRYLLKKFYIHHVRRRRIPEIKEVLDILENN